MRNDHLAILEQEARHSEPAFLQSFPQRNVAAGFLDRILIKREGKILLVRTADIDWIEAARDYVHIHASGTLYFLKERISDLERKLPPHRFFRIHRSTIINADRIADVRPLLYGDYSVLLMSGERLTLSRSRRSHLPQLMRMPCFGILDWPAHTELIHRLCRHSAGVIDCSEPATVHPAGEKRRVPHDRMRSCWAGAVCQHGYLPAQCVDDAESNLLVAGQCILDPRDRIEGIWVVLREGGRIRH
jgi:hypothetical protein